MQPNVCNLCRAPCCQGFWVDFRNLSTRFSTAPVEVFRKGVRRAASWFLSVTDEGARRNAARAENALFLGLGGLIFRAVEPPHGRHHHQADIAQN